VLVKKQDVDLSKFRKFTLQLGLHSVSVVVDCYQHQFIDSNAWHFNHTQFLFIWTIYLQQSSVSSDGQKQIFDSDVKKVNLTSTRYRSLGLELIPVYSQSTCR